MAFTRCHIHDEKQHTLTKKAAKNENKEEEKTTQSARMNTILEMGMRMCVSVCSVRCTLCVLAWNGTHSMEY